MPDGKYFLIRSKLNPSLVLDIQGGGSDPGTKVITFDAHGGDNQLWYCDHRTGSIRSKANNMCLDLEDNRLVINHFKEGDPNQQWECDGDHVCCKMDKNKVLDVVAKNSDCGAEVCSWECHGGENQEWTFEHQPPRYFYIVSKMNGKVLDIAGADASAGTKVIMWGKKDEVEDNQLWYEDRHGIIRSKLNDLVLDGSRDCLEMDNFNPDEAKQWWLIYEDKIVNRHNSNEVLDIRGENDDDGAEICPYQDHGGENQRWTIDYVL